MPAEHDIYRPDQLDATRAMVLVVDLQEKLLPLIRRQDDVVRGACRLLDGAKLFELPVLATEQYPKGIGRMVQPVRDALVECKAQVLEKAAFSAWAESSVREAMLAIDRPQVIAIGIETHVCVQQAALDLRSRDYDVYVCADAVGARDKTDHRTALDRMRSSGILVTTVEAVLFELCRRCDSPRFKPMLEIIKNHDEPF
jgi:isochorismate hydrolase